MFKRNFKNNKINMVCSSYIKETLLSKFWSKKEKKLIELMMSLWNKTYDRVQNFSFVFIVDYQRAIYFDIQFSELKDGRLKVVVCADEGFWYDDTICLFFVYLWMTLIEVFNNLVYLI